MTKLLLFGLLWWFAFVSAYSHFSESFSTDKRQAEDLGTGGKDHKLTRSISHQPLPFSVKWFYKDQSPGSGIEHVV